ncbi:MAG: S28 family serine protease [Bacteroidales bacterium]
MKKFNLFIGLILIVCFSACTPKTFKEQLSEIPQVTEVTPLESDYYAEKYLVKFTQPINYNNPEDGTFTQRVIVCNVHPDSSVLLVTEGYGAERNLNPSYQEEIADHFNTNMIIVEHRYFLESTPKNINWDYLTTQFAANDMHNIIEAFKTLYKKGKWISTGISKGGQTSTFFRTYYPNDVDISVPYVAPLNKGIEDGRHEPFIENIVGTPEARKAVKDFQYLTFRHKKQLLPLFDSLAKANNYQFYLPIEDIFDYTTLEFSFAFWQWGNDYKTIPNRHASTREIYNYMMKINGPSYFVKECYFTPFYVQAAKELGYYGYDMEPFKKYTSIKSSKNYMRKLMLPRDKDFTFDITLYNKVIEFLKTTDAHMLYIYGENDPWRSAQVPDFHRDNIKIFIQPNGCHKARIRTFNKETQKIIYGQLSEWLYSK